MDRQDEGQQYVDDLARRRGYVLDYHEVLAEQDLPVLRAVNDLVSSVYLDQRAIDRKTKELLFIVSLTVMHAPKQHIKSHIRVALDLGLAPRVILEAIEITLPEAGIVAFEGGLEAWREVVGVYGSNGTTAIKEGVKD